tara:strand:+ start:269 stop:424 length:156 start_codon:yes stop_codon:yes gene_type:complete
MTDDLVKQLQLVTDALEVTLKEPISEPWSKNWIEFCNALIEHSRAIMGEVK